MLITVERAGSVETIDLVPSKIIGIGVNYRKHAEEMNKGLPEEPLMFLKPRSAMLPDGGAIERPAGYDRVDFEGELGVVIGKRAQAVSREAALDHVLGFTCVNDVTVRDLQKKDGQWTRAKGMDTFCPIGPRIVAGLDPRDLKITTRVNGVVKQDSSTSEMVFSVAELIAFCSTSFVLEVGDVLITGTPWGCGEFMDPKRSLAPGDVVECEIDGIGLLRNPVVAAPAA